MDSKNFTRFDMSKPPVRTKWYLRPLTYILSAPDVFKHRTKITKTRTEGLKPPYLMLCNHNSFLDFKVLTKAIFPSALVLAHLDNAYHLPEPRQLCCRD